MTFTAAQRGGCQFAVELGGDRVPAWQRLKYPPSKINLDCFFVFLVAAQHEISLTAMMDLSCSWTSDSCFANKNNPKHRLTNETYGLVTKNQKRFDAAFTLRQLGLDPATSSSR